MTTEISLRTRDMELALRAISLSSLRAMRVRPDQIGTLGDLNALTALIQRHSSLVQRAGDGPWTELAELLKAVAEKCHNQGRFDEEIRLLHAAR